MIPRTCILLSMYKFKHKVNTIKAHIPNIWFWSVCHFTIKVKYHWSFLTCTYAFLKGKFPPRQTIITNEHRPVETTITNKLFCHFHLLRTVLVLVWFGILFSISQIPQRKWLAEEAIVVSLISLLLVFNTLQCRKIVHMPIPLYLYNT